MGRGSPEEIAAAVDALRAATSRVCALTFDALTTPERLAHLERCFRSPAASPDTPGEPDSDSAAHAPWAALLTTALTRLPPD